MLLFDPREPVSAWSHGAGMMLAVPFTWVFCRRCLARAALGDGVLQGAPEGLAATSLVSSFERSKAVSLLVFGLSLVICYGNSALYHAVQLAGEPLGWYRRLDHVGIYLLIAGSYTPVAWTLMQGAWRRGTLVVVWTLASCCAARVWLGGVFPPWISTVVYLGLGWAALLCYRVLARSFPHRQLALLPLGGAFYSIGAMINLMQWPVLVPEVLAAHELFHFFVMAGSACHVGFMMRHVVPAGPPLPSLWAADADASGGAEKDDGLAGLAGRLGWRLSVRRGTVSIRGPHRATGRSAETAGPSATSRLEPSLAAAE
jgi:hemolysin III